MNTSSWRDDVVTPKRRGSPFRPRKLLAGALAGMMGLLIAIPSSHADTSSGASGAINIHRQGDESQKSGTDFQYQIDVSCSDVGGAGSCDDASVFIPFEQGIDPDWDMSVLTSDEGRSITGKKEDNGYRVTFDNPLNAGDSTSFRFTVKPPTGWTPNGTSWIVDPVLSFTQGGHGVTEGVDTPVSSTATAEGRAQLRKGFGLQRNSLESTELTVDPGSDFWMTLIASSAFSGPGYLVAEPGSTVHLEDVLPEGMDVRQDLLEDEGLTYDPSTRTITAEVVVGQNPNNPQSIAIPRVKVPLTDTTNTASGQTSRVKNTATATVKFLGEDERMNLSSSADLIVAEFVPSGNLFQKNATGNAPSSLGNPEVGNSSTRNFLEDSQTDDLVSYSLRLQQASRADYKARVFDAIPCYSDTTAAGYRSPEPSANGQCDDLVMNLESLSVQHDHGVDSLDITLYLQDGSTQVMTVDLDEDGISGTVDVDVSQPVTAVEYETIITTEGGPNSSVRLFLSIPEDERLAHQTIIQNRAYAQVANLNSEYGSMSGYSAYGAIYRQAPFSRTGAQNVAVEVDSHGDVIGRYNRVLFRAGAASAATPKQSENARHVVTLPPLDSGFTLSESTLSSLEDLHGDRFAYHEQYQNAGLPAIEIVGPVDSLLGNEGSLRLDVEGLEPGVYHYDVYSGYDGQSLDKTICEPSPGYTLNAGGSEAVTPGFWPVDNTSVCHTTGTITVTTVTDGFYVDKQIRGDEGGAWESFTGRPIGTDGNAEFNLIFANTGPQDLQDVVLYDVLPVTGDTGTVAGQTDAGRGSTTRGLLTAPVEAPEGFTVYYSTSDNPQRDRVNPDLANTVDDWTTEAPSDLSTVTAIRLDGGDTRVARGEIVSAVVKVALEDEDGIAWNTVSGDADVTGQPGSLLPVEPRKVGFVTVPSGTLPQQPEPSVALDKNEPGDDSHEVEAGEHTVTVKITNDGTDGLTDFVFTDTTESGEDVVWNKDDLDGLKDLALAVGESYEITGTVQVDKGVTHRDVAAIEATGIITGETAQDDDPTTLISENPVPSIEVAKNELGDDELDVEDTDNTVTVKFTNNGEDDLTDFVFTDTTESGNDVEWNQEQLDGLKDLVLKPGESYEVTGTVEVILGTPHRDVAKVEATGVISGDPTEDDDPTTLIPDDPMPAIEVEKNERGDDRHNVESGEHTVTLSFTNTGNEPLTDFAFHDETHYGQEVQWSHRHLSAIDNLVLLPGETWTITGTVEVEKGLAHRNLASVDGTGTISGRTVNSNDPTTLIPEDPIPSIKVTKNDEGDDRHEIDSGVHDIVVKIENTGEEALRDFAFTDVTQSGEEVVWDRALLDGLQNLVLQPGESYYVRGRVDVIMGTTHRDTAHVTAEGFITGNPVQDDDPTTLVPEDPETDIVVEKNVAGDDVHEIDSGTHTVTVNIVNLGTEDLTDFVFTDTTESGEDVVWSEDELAGLEELTLKPGESYQVTGEVEVIMGTTHKDTAKVTATGVISGDPVEHEDPTTLIPEDPVTEIAVEKNDAGDDVHQINSGTHPVAVTFTNKGTEALTDFTFTDVTESGEDVVWSEDDLAGLEELVLQPGEFYQVTGEVEVIMGTTHRDTATVTATGVISGDPVEGDDPTTLIPEDPETDLKVEKGEAGDDVHNIDSGTHPVVVNFTNEGTEALTDFVFTDTTESGEDVVWNEDDLAGLEELVLAPGESYKITGEVEVIMGTKHRDVATVEATGVISGDPVEGDDPTTLVPEDPETSLIVEKNEAGDDVIEVAPGSHPVVVDFTNEGTEDLTDFVFTDVTESGEDVEWNEDELAGLEDLTLKPGESYQITGSVVVAEGEDHRDTVIIEAVGVISGDPSIGDDPTTLVPEVPVPPVEEGPETPLAKTGAGTVLLFGGAAMVLLLIGLALVSYSRRNSQELDA